MVLQMASISVGMWVKVDCKNSMGLAFEHDGIVVDIASNPGVLEITEGNPEQVIVIHYAPAGIAETTLSQFMKMGDNARIVSCYCSRGACLSSAFLLGFGFGLLASIFGICFWSSQNSCSKRCLHS